MELHNVNSSNISSIGYDIPSNVLRVVFSNGGTYDYFDVSEDVYKELDSADSKGHYLATQIKNVYSFKKVR